MADGSVDLKATANFNALQNEVARLQKKWETAEKTIERLQNRHNRFERDGSRGLQRLVQNATTVATTYFGIHRAINFVTSAMEAQRRELDKQKQSVMTASEAWNNLRMASLGMSDEQFKRLQQTAITEGAQVGLREAEVARVTQLAFSATEELDPETRIARTLGFLRAAGPTARRELAAQPEFARIGLTLQKNVFDRPGVTQEQSIGEALTFLLNFLSVSQAEDVATAGDKFLRAVSAEISASKATTPEDKIAVANAAAAMQSAIMGTIGDSVGAIGATAVANFGARMREEVGREGRPLNQVIQAAAEAGINFEDFNFTGKAITKQQQKDLAQQWGVINQRFQEAFAAFNQQSQEDLERVRQRMEGVRDPRRFLVTSQQEMAAQSERIQMEQFGRAGTVRDIMNMALQSLPGAGNQLVSAVEQATLDIEERVRPFTAERGARLLLGQQRMFRDQPLGDIFERPQDRGTLREQFERLRSFPFEPGLREDQLLRAQRIELGLEKLLEQMEVERRAREEDIPEQQAREERSIETQETAREEYQRLTEELIEAVNANQGSAAANERRNAELRE